MAEAGAERSFSCWVRPIQSIGCWMGCPTAVGRDARKQVLDWVKMAPKELMRGCLVLPGKSWPCSRGENSSLVVDGLRLEKQWDEKML